MASGTIAADLCEVCSKLNIPYLTPPLLPCRNSLPCSTPPSNAEMIVLGSTYEIKSRRFTCAFCGLVAERLDKELAGVDGECRIEEDAQYCSFKLPGNISARDPTITHFHLIQTSVILDPKTADSFHGPSFPWEVKERAKRVSHFILTLQARALSIPQTEDGAAISSQTERELLETIGGRFVDAQVNVQLIREWLHDCETKHGKLCGRYSQLLAGQEKAPSLVIDVIQPCLVDTPPQCRYVALSYVWGRASVFRHLLENSQELRKPNSLRSFPIPATIRDAITLVHVIGERYLWVDSICIVQDDLKMQQTEIMRMGSIYSNALFTIIAAAGEHANSGLPGVEPGSRDQIQKILKLGDCELLTAIDVWKGTSGIDDTVWAQRAWTFQERVLSSRTLVFSENQVYWSCRAATRSEERALEGVEVLKRLHPDFPEKSASHLPREALRQDEFCHLYDHLLYGYRERRLTYQTDILNAFNGVTEILSAIQSDSFFWGLPESHFSYAITWDIFGHSTRNYVEVPIFKNDGSKEMVPIPSWSWAAWTTNDWTHVPDQRSFMHPVVQFYLVDNERRLVKVKEQEHVDTQIRASWLNAQPHMPQSLLSNTPAQIGQLHFWTSHANVRAISKQVKGGRAVGYTLLPSPDDQPDLGPTSEIVYQDFIVIAARKKRGDLILLAIEWEDGIAHRVGRAEVKETEWARVRNRQWRLITLG